MMKLEKSPARNSERNDAYRQWPPMNIKSLLKICWGTLKGWHGFSSLESFKMGHLVITCLTQKAYTEPHMKYSRLSSKSLWCSSHPSAHLWSQLQLWGIVPTHCVQDPASRKTFNQGEREASGKFGRCCLSFPEVPTE